MRWWLRIVVTLVLAPIIWQLAAVYLGSTQGGALDTMASGSLAALPKVYGVYSLPALAVIVAILIPADRLLAFVGADLLIVFVAPLLAVLVPIVLSHLSANPRLDAAALGYLALAYGLVFGLTVREPPSPAARTPVTEGPRP